MKYFEIPGGTLLIFVSLSTLAILYFICTQTIDTSITGPLVFFLKRMGYWVSSIGMMGILFAANRLSGFHMIVMIAMMSLIMVLILTQIPITKKENSKPFSNRWLTRIALIALVNIIIFLLWSAEIISDPRDLKNQQNTELPVNQ